MSLSYYNTSMWGHENKQKIEEWRYSLPDIYHIIRETRESDYKVNLNNFEMNISYEFTPLKIFSVFGRALLKANPHKNSLIDCVVETETSLPTYRYKHEQVFRADKDAEYDVSVDYEQLFGENAEHGKFYVGYEFYSRPVKTHTDGAYTLLEYMQPCYVKDFYDFKEHTNRYENWHTATLLFRRIFKYHQFFAEEVVRYRNEKNNVMQRQSFIYDSNAHDQVEGELYKHRQLTNMLRCGYGFNSKKVSVQVGANHLFMRDCSEEPMLQNSFSTNRQFVTPYADLSYNINSKSRIRLSYSVGKQVPDIKALNPYVYTCVPGQVSYGNPELKPQSTQQLSLSANFRVGKFNLYTLSMHSFSQDIILRHSFLVGEMLHITMSNIGKRYENMTRASVSSKITRTTWMQTELNLYYTNYDATAYYQRNKGFTFSTNAYIEQELPHDIDLSLGGGYNTPYIYIQGDGEKDFFYNLRIDKGFPKKRITLGLEAKSFLPIHYDNIRTSTSTDYYCLVHNRGFHASFLLSFRWKFGKLKTEEYRVNEHYNQEDIKRLYDE